MYARKGIILASLVYLNFFFCQGTEKSVPFPIGLMDVKVKHLKKLKGGPFNIVHNYDFEEEFDSVRISEYLEEAMDCSLKVLLGLERNAIENMDAVAIRKNVTIFKDHPALGGWYLSDEPDLRGISPAESKHICNIIRQSDPYHPVLLTIALPDSYEVYANIADLTMIDPYPIPFRPPNVVAENVALAKGYAANARVGAILQAFNPNRFNPSLISSRAPTLEELRYMAYAAIINGACAVFFFSYHQMTEEFFHTVCRPVAEELSHYSEIFSDPRIGDVVLDSHVATVEYTTVMTDNTYFLLASNPNSNSVKLKVKSVQGVAPERWGVDKLIFPDKTVGIRNFEDHLPPFGVQIYRIYSSE